MLFETLWEVVFFWTRFFSRLAWAPRAVLESVFFTYTCHNNLNLTAAIIQMMGGKDQGVSNQLWLRG